MHKDVPRLSYFWQKHFFFLYQVNNCSYNWFWGVIFFCSFHWSVIDLQCCVVVLQPLSHVQLFVTPWTTTHQAFLSTANPQSFLKLRSIKSVMPFNHLILCHPLLILPWIFPSIRVSSNVSVLRLRWPKYWSFSFSISPSNKYSGLISFWIQWFDLFAFQGTLKSLLQHHSSKASILRHSAKAEGSIFIYGPTLTSIHDYWKNHSFD